MRKKRIVPTPVKKSVVEGLKPVRMGTRKVAPTEHRHDVLGADADGAGPREPLLRGNHLPRLDRAAVSVQFPT